MELPRDWNREDHDEFEGWRGYENSQYIPVQFRRH